jgi:hypothetical protein
MGISCQMPEKSINGLNRIVLDFKKIEQDSIDEIKNLVRKINTKDVGEKISAVKIVQFALKKLAHNEQAILELKDSSMSTHDKLKQNFELYKQDNPACDLDMYELANELIKTSKSRRKRH